MIEFVEPGAVIGKTIYDTTGRTLLRSGTVITSTYLRRLKKMGYTAIYIDDFLTHDIVVEDYVPQELKAALISEIRHTFQATRDHRKVENFLSDKNVYRITDLINSMLDSIHGNELFELHMGSILNKDEALCSHSFHVGLFSTIIAIAKGLDASRVQEIGIGALLHDIGKVTIPDSILNKPGQLTPDEWRAMEYHTTIGYDIIRKQSSFSVVSAHCAYQHHERLDGTGYPRRLKGNDIHMVGRITAVADVFDAMTTARPYKRPILPSEVMEYLYVNSGTKFDPVYVHLFRDNIALYPVGVTITLSDNRRGVVVRNHRHHPQRPVVRIFTHGEEPVSPYDFDMSESLNVTISALYLNSNLRGNQGTGL